MSDRPLLFAIAPQHRSALYELELSMAAADHFDAVFRQVVRFRLDWSVREGNHIFPETVALWNSLR